MLVRIVSYVKILVFTNFTNNFDNNAREGKLYLLYNQDGHVFGGRYLFEGGGYWR